MDSYKYEENNCGDESKQYLLFVLLSEDQTAFGHVSPPLPREPWERKKPKVNKQQ